MRPSRAARVLLATSVAVILAGVVAGCSTLNPSSAPITSSTPTDTATSSDRPTSTSSSQPIAVGQCDAASLSGSIGQGTGGAAGSVGVTIVLTNTGSSACTLQGWPGVSFVGDSNGTQLGAAAGLDHSAPHPTVQLAPGGKAQAPLRLTQALNYPQSDCQPVKADGFRVYPPGSTQAVFIADTAYTACTSQAIVLLTVGALTAG